MAARKTGKKLRLRSRRHRRTMRKHRGGWKCGSNYRPFKKGDKVWMINSRDQKVHVTIEESGTANYSKPEESWRGRINEGREFEVRTEDGKVHKGIAGCSLFATEAEVDAALATK